MTRRCAFLTMDSLENFVNDDALLHEPLRKRGWSIESVSWREPNVDWNRFDVVLIRTPWDYQEDPEAFLKVLREIEDSNAQLENDLEIVRWNLDKHYLQVLQSRGVELVPTQWRSAGMTGALELLFDTFFTEELILKPRIGANADHTFRVRPESLEAQEPDIEQAFQRRDFMVQPFVSSVVQEGEYSLFFFNGSYSHAILKTPKTDDFRVQEEHGGLIQAVEPEPRLREAAQRAVEALGSTLLYARADLVRSPENQFWLMELELIEPALYFRMDPDSPERFVQALEDWLQVNGSA